MFSLAKPACLYVGIYTYSGSFFTLGVSFFCQLRLLMTLDSSRVATLVVSVVLIIYGSFRYVHYIKISEHYILSLDPVLHDHTSMTI